MYKVLIVDDEKIVRLAIQSMIRWEENRLEFAGSAGNGAEALELFHRIDLDIVITDLKMPVMDGLELIKRLKQENYRGEILVLSNYNDFELVREAMKYGAHDYILKVTVGSNNFADIMKEIVAKLDKKRRGGGERRIADSRDENRVAFLTGILKNGNFNGIDDPKDTMELQNGGCIQTYLVCCEDENAKEKSTAEILNTILQDFQSRMDYRLAIPLDEKRSILVLHYSGREKEPEAAEPGFVAERLKQLIKIYYNMDINIVYGINIRSFSALLNELQNCISAMYLFFYADYRKNNLSNTVRMTEDESTMESLVPKTVQQIAEGLTSFDRNAVRRAIQDLIHVSRASNLNPVLLKKTIKTVARMVGKRMARVSEEWAQEANAHHEYGDDILEATTDEGLLSRIDVALESAAIQIKNGKPYRKEIMSSIGFIEQHIASHITVLQIAEHVNMTETYISKLFRSETGRSIIDYINYCKMKKAYELLSGGDCLIKEAADAVGIDNPFYFSRLFKKYYGKNPSSIKKTS